MNQNNLIKYLVMFFVVSYSTYFIPNCSIMNQHAFYIGLLASTTFVILDNNFPNIIIKGENEID